jgi:hypothetical protein
MLSNIEHRFLKTLLQCFSHVTHSAGVGQRSRDVRCFGDGESIALESAGSEEGVFISMSVCSILSALPVPDPQSSTVFPVSLLSVRRANHLHPPEHRADVDFVEQFECPGFL